MLEYALIYAAAHRRVKVVELPLGTGPDLSHSSRPPPSARLEDGGRS